MKRILTFITLFSLLLTACEGDPGPPGLDGLDGLDGEPAAAFEIELDFTSTNDFSVVEPYGFTVLPTDITLVFILFDVIDGQEIWRLLPQTIPFDDGDLVYNFDFTQVDVRFFLDGTTDFNALDPIWTDAQVFRVAVIPADNVGRRDLSDINAVMRDYGIESFPRR